MIRRAAVEVFRQQGLGAPLDEVARVAGLSKGTIYHRFGGRQGLVDEVIEELAAARICELLRGVELLADPLERFEQFLRRIWLLQYDDPVANDVLLRSQPASQPLEDLCEQACDVGRQSLAAAQQAGVVRTELTGEDLYQLIWERGVIIRSSERSADQDHQRQNYARRLDIILRGLRT